VPVPFSYFSTSYAQARERFRDAATRAGAVLHQLPIGAAGPRSERLTIDVAWCGAPRPIRAFVHTSGVHGVEGFAGSAIQLQWLTEDPPVPAADNAVAIVHVVNPFGMAWLRRVNPHNVDLNRNCLPAGQPYSGAPSGYAQLDAFLNPMRPESTAAFYWHALRLVAAHGMASLRQAVAGGQYTNPGGLFFGGASLEQEPRLLAELFRPLFERTERVIGVDVHTGLGPFGVDTLIVSDSLAASPFERLRAVFGDRVTSSDPRRGPAYRATGTVDGIVRRAARGAAVDFLVQEFGTYHSIRVLRALREENRRYRLSTGAIVRGGAPAGSMLVDVFAPASLRWRAAVLERGRAVIRRALDFLDTAPLSPA
jgi:hypothetical protein